MESYTWLLGRPQEFKPWSCYKLNEKLPTLCPQGDGEDKARTVGHLSDQRVLKKTTSSPLVPGRDCDPWGGIIQSIDWHTAGCIFAMEIIEMLTFLKIICTTYIFISLFNIHYFDHQSAGKYILVVWYE